MTNTNDNAKNDLLKEEYFNIQRQIEIYDEKALNIKAWSVTVSITGIGTAFHQHVPELLLISAFSSLLFWSIEVYWKIFQRAFFSRSRKIESYFANPQIPIEPLQISRSWLKSFSKLKRKPKTYLIILYPHIMLPHAIVTIGGLVLYLLGICSSK
jgi:hypothetical protein